MHNIKNSFVYTVIFTFVLCFLFVLILSFTNAATVDIIKENVEFEQQQAILKALGANPTDVQTKPQVQTQFTNVEQLEANGSTYYKGIFNGETTYASAYSGPGLWGIINGYISMNEKVDTLMGFQVTSQNETPGLGARIAEPWFSEQIRGEKVVNNNVRVTGGGTGDADKRNGQIDGITGATRTSDGVQVIISKSIERFQKDLGGR